MIMKFQGLKKQKKLRLSSQLFQIFSVRGGNTAGGDQETLVLSSPSFF